VWQGGEQVLQSLRGSKSLIVQTCTGACLDVRTIAMRTVCTPEAESSAYTAAWPRT